MEKELKGYQGMFFNEDTQKLLLDLQNEGTLKNPVKDMHITFFFGNTEIFPDEIMEKDYRVIIDGYKSDGKNSGFRAKIPEELLQYYKNLSVEGEINSHITVSLGEDGKAKDTGNLEFDDISPVDIQGRMGYFIFGKGIVLDNNTVRNEKQKIANEVNNKPDIRSTLSKQVYTEEEQMLNMKNIDLQMENGSVDRKSIQKLK